MLSVACESVVGGAAQHSPVPRTRDRTKSGSLFRMVILLNDLLSVNIAASAGLLLLPIIVLLRTSCCSCFQINLTPT